MILNKFEKDHKQNKNVRIIEDYSDEEGEGDMEFKEDKNRNSGIIDA